MNGRKVEQSLVTTRKKQFRFVEEFKFPRERGRNFKVRGNDGFGIEFTNQNYSPVL